MKSNKTRQPIHIRFREPEWRMLHIMAERESRTVTDMLRQLVREGAIKRSLSLLDFESSPKQEGSNENG